MLGARGAALWRSAGPTLRNTRPFGSANVGLDSEFISLFNQPTTYMATYSFQVEVLTVLTDQRINACQRQ